MLLNSYRDKNYYDKPLFDIIFSFMGLIILSPIFYRGIRVGRDGVLFRMLKFRTIFRHRKPLSKEFFKLKYFKQEYI